jgi:hypothetical protein
MARPKRGPTDESAGDEAPPPASSTPKEQVQGFWLAATGGMVGFHRVADRFGAPAGVATVMLAFVYFFGTEETRNDFVRAVVFGEAGWMLPTCGLVVCVDFLWGYGYRRRWIDGESSEMKRIATQKTELQERLLERDLKRSIDLTGTSSGERAVVKRATAKPQGDRLVEKDAETEGESK